MELSYRIEKDIYVIYFEGNLAQDTATRAQEYVQELLSESHPRGMIFNWVHLHRIDSSGINFTLHTNQFLQDFDARLVLCHVKPTMEDLIKTLSLDQILTIYPTEDEVMQQRMMIFD